MAGSSDTLQARSKVPLSVQGLGELLDGFPPGVWSELSGPSPPCRAAAEGIRRPGGEAAGAGHSGFPSPTPAKAGLGNTATGPRGSPGHGKPPCPNPLHAARAHSRRDSTDQLTSRLQLPALGYCLPLLGISSQPHKNTAQAFTEYLE